MKTELFLNHTVSAVLGGRRSEGDLFGIELELEGRGVGLQDIATRGWQRHNDGSLRGESIEFTTSGGKSFEESQKLVKELFKKFKDNNVKFNNSIRTSTHVHLNFSDKPIKAAINFFVLFTLLEEVLQYYSGEDRKGNVFCLSSRDAEGIVQVLSEALATGNLHQFSGDRYKYAACNLCSLFKFGTIEIRTMRGAKSEEEVNNWLSILNDMYKYSLKMISPAALINDLSYKGAEGLMLDIFSEGNYKELMKDFPAPRTLHASLMDGARILQVLAYEYEPAFLAKVEVKKIPKGADLGRLPWYQTDVARITWLVYRRNGERWSCVSLRMRDRGGDTPPDQRFWAHTETTWDDRSIRWDQGIGRFVEARPGLAPIPLNWVNHPVLGDEGPPGLLGRGRALLQELEEPEEPDWDEEEDD
jgi:hypothetical protein